MKSTTCRSPSPRRSSRTLARGPCEPGRDGRDGRGGRDEAKSRGCGAPVVPPGLTRRLRFVLTRTAAALGGGSVCQASASALLEGSALACESALKEHGAGEAKDRVCLNAPAIKGRESAAFTSPRRLRCCAKAHWGSAPVQLTPLLPNMNAVYCNIVSTSALIRNSYFSF